MYESVYSPLPDVTWSHQNGDPSKHEAQRLMCIGCSLFTWSVCYVYVKQIDRYNMYKIAIKAI